ncbi:LacI family DNA-binding transcriptional regulator [Ruania alba]|uniref:Transcriptional regulator, LacI family n=1 Tax=Ruania alba TaxID=648782 RepID=A0A1H5KZF7_9MICO|nr:LacI family DNA-binding transcriptional regulator [Ruania alba]SEE70222.1 transcriptional regulator, LacI family [Ruania alba]
MPTLSEVAAHAGVSVSVASRALTGDPRARVSPATRERVRHAASELGYRPNFAGRALRLARTEVLALVVPGITNSLVYELIRGVEDEAASAGYTVLLGRAEDIQPGNPMVDRLLGEGRVDGMILQPVGDMPTSDFEHVFRFAAPIVTIHREVEGASSVAVPDLAGTAMATRYLAQRGHHRIGLIGGPPASQTAARREAGFRSGMAASGLEISEEWVLSEGFIDEDGVRGLRRMMALAETPTAVVAANVHAAVGVLAESRRLGLSVPGDLSVMSVHDSWSAEHTWPPLSSVKLPLYELGREAVVSLLAEVGGRDAGDRKVVQAPPPMLIERESVGPPSRHSEV